MHAKVFYFYRLAIPLNLSDARGLIIPGVVAKVILYM